MYTAASQPWHNTLHNLHIDRPHTRRVTKAVKRLIWLIHPFVSRLYNEAKFNCANKQAGAIFDIFSMLLSSTG